jgi:SulP family sulfate permease
VGAIPNKLPSYQMIDLELFFKSQTLMQLLPASIVIAFVAFVEAIAIDKVMCEKHGEKLNANQELFSIGMSNIGGALFGGYPITGGLSRTAFNSQAGAKTALASLITVVSVVLTLLFLTGFLSDLPKATLSVLIIFAVSQLIKFKVGKALWHQDRFHAVIWGITLFSTLYFGVQWGLLVGLLSEIVLGRILNCYQQQQCAN